MRRQEPAFQDVRITLGYRTSSSWGSSPPPLKQPVVAFTLIQARCERWPTADGSCRIPIVPDHADGTVATIVLGTEKKSADEWWAALLARQEQREQPIIFDQGVYLRQKSRRGRNASWRLRFFRLDLQSQALHYLALHTAQRPIRR